jgi:hypothetical protein
MVTLESLSREQLKRLKEDARFLYECVKLERTPIYIGDRVRFNNEGKEDEGTVIEIPPIYDKESINSTEYDIMTRIGKTVKKSLVDLTLISQTWGNMQMQYEFLRQISVKKDMLEKEKRERENGEGEEGRGK